MKALIYSAAVLFAMPTLGLAQEAGNSGLDNRLGNLYRLSDAKSLSISPENPTGEKGKGGMAIRENASPGDLGQGWKVRPSVAIAAGATFTVAEINGSGEIQHIWMTPTGNWRFSILRMYWDDETEPSVETPVGDFFAMGWGKFAPISSLAVCVNPGSGFNSYWPMPFRKKARITLENLDSKSMTVYYQVDYAQASVPKDAAYFHAQFRRVKQVQDKQVYTIVDGIQGKGQYVGTYMAIAVHSNGWWGEGEIKFYMDGDRDFPTINGTGTEDYFNGAYNFDVNGKYEEFTGPYSGLAQVIRPDALYQSQERFGLYRWHIADPIRFDHDLRVTIHDLGWQPPSGLVTRNDDIATVAFWYQTEPHAPFPKLPGRDELATF